jgi:hypothetical protein
MTTHEDNLARVQTLRDDPHFRVAASVRYTVGRWKRIVTGPLLDLIEDVFTRHAPERFVHADVGPRCMEPCDTDWPCPEYASALTLLDALDGGAFPRSVYPATPGTANVALDDEEAS